MKHKILKNKPVLLILFLTAIFLILYRFGLFAPIKDTCIYYTKHFKLPGLFAVSIFLDLFVHPFTAGFFVAAAVAGGINMFLAVLAASAGSMIGGSLYYFLGRADKRVIDADKHNRLWNRLSGAVNKNTLLFLFLFSATTGPFSVISFFAGNIKVPYYRYLPVAFAGRYMKFFFYALAVLGIFHLAPG